MFLGIPIFMCMLAAGIIGSLLIGGVTFTFQVFASGTYYYASAYTFAVIPMFMLMGILAADCGVAEDAYVFANKWFGERRGGLLMATVGANAVFGACSGSPLASLAVFTKISLPEIDKANYHRPTSLACLASSSVLSTLIPPSMPIVIFCILGNVSIGRALVGGIVPGIILAILLMVAIGIIAKIRPDYIPVSSKRNLSFREKIMSSYLVLSILIVFVLIIGGMYAGVFPPTVAGAIGAAGILLIAVIRRISLQKIVSSVRETISITAQIFPLLIGGLLFSRFISISQLPDVFAKAISSAGLSPYAVMGLVMLLYLVMGCVMDLLPLMVITIPILFPILIAAGFDPIVVIMILVMLGATGFLTPPIGMFVFIIAGMTKEDPMKIYRAIGPFLIVYAVLIILMLFVPAVVTWLPNLFYGKPI